jgi:transcription initiation factor IIF auxiliary subunit
MLEALKIQQWEEYIGEDWWKWAVWIEAPNEMLGRVEYVEWKLHSTFPNPVRKTADTANKFRLETAGWGEFLIIARVQMKDGTQVKLRHNLKLYYPDGAETKA